VIHWEISQWVFRLHQLLLQVVPRPKVDQEAVDQEAVDHQVGDHQAEDHQEVDHQAEIKVEAVDSLQQITQQQHNQ
jgi:hypothetical protein